MARIFCVTSGLRGMLYSSLELARRLAADGHTLSYASVPAVRDLVAAHGVASLDLETPVPAGPVAFLREDARRAWPGRLLRIAERRDRAIAMLDFDTFDEQLNDLRPELVLLDCEMHEHIVAAATTRERPKIALLNSFVSIWRRPGLPPPNRLAVPGRGWKGSRLGMALLWWILRLRKLGRRQWHRARGAGCDRVSLLDHLARRRGWSLRDEIDYGQWLIPFTYRRLPYLTLHARELELPHEPADTVSYLGPMIPRERPETERETSARRVFGDVLEQLALIRSTEPEARLVYAGFGSFFSVTSNLVTRLIECFRGRPQWQLVLSLGDAGLSESQDLRARSAEFPDNVHVVPWVPQLEVLAAADAAIVHGGTNTVEECLLKGVPMLVYCGYETDMAGTTSRVDFHGLGIVGRHSDSPTTIERHLVRLLVGNEFEAPVSAMARAVGSYEERRVAERTIGDLLEAV